MENMECLMVNAYTSFIDSKVGMSLNHGVSLRFILRNMLGNISSKELRKKPAPLLALHLPYSLALKS